MKNMDKLLVLKVSLMGKVFNKNSFRVIFQMLAQVGIRVANKALRLNKFMLFLNFFFEFYL